MKNYPCNISEVLQNHTNTYQIDREWLLNCLKNEPETVSDLGESRKAEHSKFSTFLKRRNDHQSQIGSLECIRLHKNQFPNSLKIFKKIPNMVPRHDKTTSDHQSETGVSKINQIEADYSTIPPSISICDILGAAEVGVRSTPPKMGSPKTEKS